MNSNTATTLQQPLASVVYGQPATATAAVSTATVTVKPITTQPVIWAHFALPPLETRLQAFYKTKHNPAKLQNGGAAFAQTVGQYRGNEAALNKALFATYGTTLDGAAPQQPQQVVYMQQPRAMETNYCGPISLLIGCFVPCGFWICLCLADKGIVHYQTARACIFICVLPHSPLLSMSCCYCHTAMW